jgi:hypothetical protein
MCQFTFFNCSSGIIDTTRLLIGQFALDLEITFEEDRGQMRDNYASGNFAILRYMAVNMLKQENIESQRSSKTVESWLR